MAKLSDVKTGDILAWKRDRRNKLSNIFIKAIRFFTGGDFGHIGVAIRIFGYLFVLEASLPLVRLSLVRVQEEVFLIRMPREADQPVVDWLVRLVGLSYGIRDALRALRGTISKKDDEWQCGEIVLEFCRLMGYTLNDQDIAFTPDEIVDALCETFETEPELLTE